MQHYDSDFVSGRLLWDRIKGIEKGIEQAAKNEKILSRFVTTRLGFSRETKEWEEMQEGNEYARVWLIS